MQDSSIEQKTLGFIGAYSLDLILLMTQVLALLDFKVLVIDRGDCHMLHYFLNPLEKDMDQVSIVHENITYVTVPKIEEDKSKYDVVIVNYDSALTYLSDYVKSDCCFVVSDQKKHHVAMVINQIRFINEFLDRPKQVVKIYRDMLPSKIDESYLDFVYGLEEFHNVVGSYLFDFHQGNILDDMENAYNQHICFRNVSEGYKEFVQDVIEEMFLIPNSDIKRVIKQLRKGK